MANNLAQIRNNVKLWLKRRDVEDATITTCINLAVTRLERTLRLPSMEGVIYPQLHLVNIDPDDGFEPKFPIPSDFLEIKHLYVTNKGVDSDVERRDLAWVKRHQSMANAQPCWFARQREFIELSPPPVAKNEQGDFDCTMVYYFECPELAADSDSNWFLSSAEGAVLYGALTELFLFLRDEQEAMLWEQKFQGEAQAIQAQADNSEWAGSTLTIKSRV